MEVHVRYDMGLPHRFYRNLRYMSIKATSSIRSLAKSMRGNYGLGLFSLFAREK